MVLLCRAVPRCVAWRRVPGQALPSLLGLARAALGAGLEGTRLGGWGGGTQCVRGQEEYGGAERPKPREPAARLEKAKQKSAQQELKQRQRAEIYALNRVMTELEQQQFDSFCKQMQAPSE
uniref:Small vasohibin-binding protein n=1 Tax=Anas zonorhyncha TaxID=75864 RepID=A0A8B9UDH6_9AVES